MPARRLASLLESRKEELVERWLRRLKETTAPSGRTDGELRDSVGDYIEDLVKALRAGPSPATSSAFGRSQTAREHGRQRYQLGFDLELVVREYGLLRESILELVEAANAGPDVRDVGILTGFFVAGIAEAVSEYQRQQAEARRVEHVRELRRVEELLMQAPALVAVLRGREHVFEMANRRYVRAVGREVVGKTVREALPELANQPFFELLDRVYSTGEPHVANGVVVRLSPERGESELILNFIYQPLRDPEGKVDGIFVHAVDVTTEVRAEQQRDVALEDAQAAKTIAEQALIEVQHAHEVLQQSERQFRTLADTLPQLAWMADEHGETFWFNQRWYEYTGTTPEEMSGRGWRRLHHPEWRERAIRRYEDAIATGQPWEDTFPLRRADGEFRWFLSRAMPVRDSEGRIVRWIGTNTDIEDQRRSEAALQDRIEFEQQLIGIVSHDLRNPLQAILLGTRTLLHRESLDERMTRPLLRIQSSAERGTRLIRELLDFSEARLGGGLRVERRPMDLCEQLDDFVEEVASGFPDRKVEVLAEGDCRGRWDPDRISQLVSNLVTNALKYSPPGSPVRVHLHGAPAEVTLRVHNTGVAIPPERLSKLFLPFERATGEVDHAGRSVGLGLYIVAQILKAHDGSVEVDSTAERGTTFTVHLPRG